MRLLHLRLILCNESEIIPSFTNFTTLTDFFTFFVSMSMFKNPLNLNVYSILMIADKNASIFKIDATEDLNYSFSSYISLCK